MKRKLKKLHFGREIEANRKDGRKLWQLLREATNMKETNNATEPTNLTKPIANVFNSFFATIGKKTLQKLGTHEPTFIPSATSGYSFHPITPSEVELLIENLKTNTAVGYDKIPAKILKDLKSTISTPLSKIINLSFETDTFPISMKHAVVRPIFKNKGSDDDPQFYRPISVLTALSKIIERAATNRIVKFLENHNKLYNSQHAYRQHHSTITSLVETTEYIHEALEMKQIPAIVATDLSKAFDSVSHTLLLQKLEKMGFHKSCINWIKSYLSHRTQITKFSSVESDEEVVQSGVPQGSILGPVLFIAYTADLAQDIKGCKFVAYADDAALLLSATTTVDLKRKIETTINLVRDWYTRNGLQINADKTEYLVVNSKRKFNITIHNGEKEVTISPKETMKVLGMKIDSKLTWKNHIAQIRSRASNAIRNIARSNNILSLPSRVILTNALVVPHYNYGDIIYDGCSASARDQIERSQNYAAKALLGRSKFSSATNALLELNWIPLSQRRKIHQGVFVHKALHNKSSHHATTSIKNLLPHHSYSTRQKQDNTLNSRTHSTTRSEKSVIYRSTHAWNSFPRQIRGIEDTKKFKDSLQMFFIDKYKEDSDHVGRTT